MRRAPTRTRRVELAGMIVLVDRGSCSFSLKIANIGTAGGRLGIIGLVTPDAPFGGAFGGGIQTIPGYMISQADANLLRTGTASVRFDRQRRNSAGSLASTSSRGPRFDDNIIKPEIGAPGASVSAKSGSFTGTAAFGGTSGAAPMVTGAAALLKGAATPLGSRNQADPGQHRGNRGIPAELLGLGVAGSARSHHAYRRWRSASRPRIARTGDRDDVSGDKSSKLNAGLSFGYLDASKPKHTLHKLLEVENTTNRRSATR